MSNKKNFRVNGITSDVNLETGNIYSYAPNLIASDVNISDIATQDPAIITLQNNLFTQPTRGVVEVFGVTTTTEANGIWYFESSGFNNLVLFTSKTYENAYNGTLWTVYTPQETLTNTNLISNNNIIVNPSVDLNYIHVQVGWTASDGSNTYSVVEIQPNTPSGYYTFVMSGGNFSNSPILFTGPNGGGQAKVTLLNNNSVKLNTASQTFEITNFGEVIYPDGTIQTTAYQVPVVNYRGFTAGCNRFWGDDPSVNQIIITNDSGPVYYSNASDDTDIDSFLALNIDESTINVILNLYGNYVTNPIPTSQLITFTKAFIDTVLYGGGDILVDAANAKINFYNSIESLINLLPTNTLYYNFAFSDNSTSPPTYTNVPYTTTSVAGTGFACNITLEPKIYVLQVTNFGTEYQIGDVFTFDGSNLGGVSGVNDCIVTVTDIDVGNNNTVIAYTVSGTPNFPWPSDHIFDGGSDQYDSGNYIKTNLYTNIPYGDGEVITGIQSNSYFGTGSSYVTVYQNSVFAMMAFNTIGLNLFGFANGGMGADSFGTKQISLLIGGSYAVSDLVNSDKTASLEENGDLILSAGNIVAQNIGNITSINLDGNSSNVLYGNGVFASATTAGGLPLANGNSNLNIATIDGNVTITANGSTTWTFDTTGNLTTPSNLTIGPVPASNGSSILQYDAPLQVVGEGANSFIIAGWAETTAAPSNIAVMSFNSPLGGAGNVGISTGNNGGTQYNWIFDNTGNLTLPGGGIIYGEPFTPSGAPGNTITLQPAGSGTITDQKLMVYPTAGDGDHIHMVSGNLYQTELFLGSDLFFAKLANTGNFEIQTNDNNGNIAQFTFGTDGNLRLATGASLGYAGLGYTGFTGPNGGPIEIDTYYLSGNLSSQIFSDASGNVNISVFDDGLGNAYHWRFDNTGNLTLPNNTVAINFANGAAAFSNLVQWTTAPVANTSAGSAGQAAYDTGGNLYVCISTNTWAKFTGTTSW